MKLSFNLKSISQLFRKNIHYLLWVFLIAIIALEFFVVKAAYDMVALARNPAPGAQGKVIRVDFEQYKKIEQRLEASAEFEPGTVTYPNPFGLPPAAPPPQ